MAQILQVSFGQSGCNMGYEFWKQIASEHEISADGESKTKINSKLEKVGTYFRENSKGNYFSTGIFIDTEPDHIDRLLTKPYSKLFNSSNLIQGKIGAGNNFIKGSSSFDREEYRDVFRKQIEIFDHFYGFEFTHSISGGTGSGTFSKLMEYLDGYPEVKSTFTLLPHLDYPSNVLEYYNSILTIPSLVEQIDQSICFDNAALFKLDVLQSSNKNFESANKLIVQTMSAMSSSLRFPGQLNFSYKKILLNLVPFKRQHFLVSSVCPPLIQQSTKISNIQDQLNYLTSPENFLLSNNKQDNLFLASHIQIRGSSVSTWEVESTLSNFKNQQKNQFQTRNPNGYSIGYCNKTSNNSQMECVSISNPFLIKQSLQNIQIQVEKLLSKKFYVWKFKELGMDEMQFDEALSQLGDIISEYYPFNEGMGGEE